MTPPDDFLLPTGSRLVHIGPHKTGSTAIQVALHKARHEIAELGVHYQGSGPRDRSAGWALGLPGKWARVERPPIEEWQRLVREVRDAQAARVCVSNEDFGRADDVQAARIVEDLGGDRVHVVAVARRLDRYLASQWQERVKASDPRSFERWLEVVLHGDESSWDYRNVWGAHDLERLIARWTDVVGPDRFTLVVSSDRDRERLPRLFEAMLGLPEGELRLYPEKSNVSLGFDEVETLRAVNAEFRRRGWRDGRPRSAVKHGVIPELARLTREAASARPPLPDWAVPEVVALSRRRVEVLRDTTIRVVGDPDELLVPAGVESLPAGDFDDRQVRAELAGAAVAAAVEVALRRTRPTGARSGRRTAVEDLSGRELLRLALARGWRRLGRG